MPTLGLHGNQANFFRGCNTPLARATRLTHTLANESEDRQDRIAEARVSEQPNERPRPVLYKSEAAAGNFRQPSFRHGYCRRQ